MPSPHIGSTWQSTRQTAPALTRLLADLGVQSLVDVPCGIGDWVVHCLPEGCRYIGLDIRASSIEYRLGKNEVSHHHFERFNILESVPPRADAVLFRDLAIHLSNGENMIAINHLKRSGSRWLIASTFTDRENEDLKGNTFRNVNLERAPYGFPPPERSIRDPVLVDGVPKETALDRTLGLWPLSVLPTYSASQIESAIRGSTQSAEHFLERSRRHRRRFGNVEQAMTLLRTAMRLEPGLAIDPEERALLEEHQTDR